MRVNLLGGLSVVSGRNSLDGSVIGRRAGVVLARLALAGPDGVSRDVLAEAVWGESTPRSWRPALRNVMTELRRSIEGAGMAASASVTTSSGGYALVCPDGLRVDLAELFRLVDRAEEAWRAGDYLHARELSAQVLTDVGRPVLPGVDGEWVEGLRQKASAATVLCQELGAQAALAMGDTSAAERHARQLVASQPLRESGHRLLMEALRQGGNRAEALEAYYACRGILAEALGALPDFDTEALYLAVLAEERRQDAATVGLAEVPAYSGSALLLAATSTPFVGRDDLVDELVSRLEMAEVGGALAVCISGEPGIGKTRLAAELAARAAQRRLPQLYGRSDNRLSVPFGSWLGPIDQALGEVNRFQVEGRLGRHLAVLGSLLPSLRVCPDLCAQDLVGLDRQRIVAAIVACLRLLLGSGGLLILDDAQWARAGEMEVVESLLADPRAVPVLVVVLHRSQDDLGALGSMGAHPRITRLELQPLTVGDISQLAGALRPVGPSVERATAATVWSRSGGNPLFASVLLASGPDGNDQPSSATVEGLISERLAALPRDAHRVLGVAAVAGPEFDPALIATASRLGAATVGEHLELARRSGLLVDAGGHPGWLAFRHGLVRERLLDELDTFERARAHRWLGSTLEASVEGTVAAPVEIVDVAYHLGAAQTSNWCRELHYGAAAARLAYNSGVYEDAAEVATRTLNALERAANPDPDAALDLQVIVGGSLVALGDGHGAEILNAAFAEAKASGDPVRMADAALAFSGTGALSDEMAIGESRLGLYTEAVDALGPGQDRRRALLLGRIASGRAWRHADPTVGSAGIEALALARQTGDPVTLATVLAEVRRSISGSGGLAERAAIEDELTDLAASLDDPRLTVSVSLWRFDTAVLSGKGEHLEELLAKATACSRGLLQGQFHHSIAYEYASLALLRGRLDEADVLVERAAAIGRHHGIDAGVVEAVRLAHLTVVRSEQDRLAELRPAAAAFFEPSGVPAWLGVMAYLDAAVGHMDKVGERLEAMMDDFAGGLPSAVCPPGLLAYMAAPAVRLGDPALVRRLRCLIEPWSGQGGYFGCFAGPIDHHLGVLSRFLGEETEAKRRFAAAAFAARLGAPRWRRRCQRALDAHR